jgi:hypothetical protein
MLDADEVLSNKERNVLTKEELENIIDETNERTISPFTLHFLYNYFTIDGRDNGKHFSLGRLFKNKNVRYINEMHELIKYDDEEQINTFQKTYKTDKMIIFHFGGCKNPEKIRKKYTQCMKIMPEIFNTDDPNHYCKYHELFRGTRPVIRYFGALPKVMKLW